MSHMQIMAKPIISYGESLTKANRSCPAPRSAAKLFRHVVLEVAPQTVSDPRM